MAGSGKRARWSRGAIITLMSGTMLSGMPPHAWAQPIAPGSWDGVYAGISLGAGRLNTGTTSNFTSSSNTLFTTLIPSAQFSTSLQQQSFTSSDSKWGGLGDVFIGYNAQWNNVVLGVQAEGTLSRINTPINQSGTTSSRSTTQDVTGGVAGPITVNASSTVQTLAKTAQLNWMLSVLLRAGYAFDSRSLVYALGGFTYGGFETTLNPGGDPGFGASGWTLGAGIERKLDPSWSAKLEYRYTKFQDVTLTSFENSSSFLTTAGGNTNTTTGASAGSATFSTDLHTIRLGLSHYFNGGPDRPALMAAASAPAANYGGWGGFYAGFSLGAGSLNTSTSTRGQDGENSFSTITFPPAPPFSSTTTTSGVSSFSGSGRNVGGMADLFLGYNVPMGNFLAGVQLEGTVSRFNSAANSTGVRTSNNNFFAISTGTTSSSRANLLQLQWMASVLARAGYVASARDLLYVVGGWTYGSFETDLETDSTFGANGVTVGAGWERKLDPSWSLKVEGRYTKFQDVTLNTATLRSSTSSSSSGVISSSSTSVSSTMSATTISNDLYAVRVGLTRYFDPAWPSGPLMASAQRPWRNDTYAAPYVPSWSGLYAGVSLGAGRLNTGTATGASSTRTNTTTLSTSTQPESISGTSNDSKWGGLADVFIGYNFQWNRVVAGIQAEGSLGRINVPLNQTLTTVDSQTTASGGVTSTNNSRTTATPVNSAQLNWMFSVLLRAGYLADMSDLVYVLGGWTYAGFETNLNPPTVPIEDPGFAASGWTIGGGIERMLDPSWSAKLEYRYTKFQDVTLSAADTRTSVAGTSTSTASGAGATTFSNNLHVVRFGLSHYFHAGPDSVAVMAANYPVKAPPPPANYASWSGFTGGFSLGGGALNTQTSALRTEAFSSVDTTIAPGTTTVTTGLTNSTLSLAGNDRKFGAMADLFVGYNVQRANWVAGLAVEGTVSRFNSGIAMAGPISGASTGFTTINGVLQPGASSSSQGGFSAVNNIMQLQWMVSVLARAGYLYTPRDLIYALGGWTYGSFETDLANDPTFSANGVTVGAGWERKIDPAWSFKLEGRYTKFQDVTLTGTTGTTATTPHVPAGTGATVGSFSNTSTTTVSNNLWALRVGLTRYFNQ